MSALPDAVSPQALASAPALPVEAAPPPPPARSPARRVAGIVRHPARIAPAVRVRVEQRVLQRVRQAMARIDQAESQVSLLQAQLDRTNAELARVRADQAALTTELHLDAPLALDRIEVNRINTELLKGEVRSLESIVQELGMAFAPATGLAGAATRFSELREAVNGLERRLRNLSIAPPAGPSAPSADAPDTGPAADAPPPVGRPGAHPSGGDEQIMSTLFNYVGFERRFRGDPDVILQVLDDRYGQVLSAHQPVVDVGCGRGELLSRLAGRGVEVIGVEPDPGMVAEVRARGITVHQALIGEYLRSVPDSSLGSIISTHVVEHLQLDDLIEFLELAVVKLKPGGVFIAETPNPASLIVLGNSYILDPTHVWPLHPSLLAFLAESAGYRDVRLNFYAPAESYRLPPVDDTGLADDVRPVADAVNAAFGKLNDVLFGPQEYSITATTPS